MDAMQVDVAELDRQMASQKQAKYMESARQKLFAHESLECSRMVDRIQQEASYIRQLRNMRTAKLLENQIAEKQMKEYEQKVQSRFTVDNEFLNRFGTSHR